MQVIKLDVLNEIDRAKALGIEIDILFNNAGIMESGPMVEIPMTVFRSVFETNVFAALELAQGFARAMGHLAGAVNPFYRSLGRGSLVAAGVYGGAADPLPMMDIFDRQLTIRMGQANVRRWTDELLALLVESDPFDVDTLATHRLPLADAARAYEMFQNKKDGCLKVVLTP